MTNDFINFLAAKRDEAWGKSVLCASGAATKSLVDTVSPAQLLLYFHDLRKKIQAADLSGFAQLERDFLVNIFEG